MATSAEHGARAASGTPDRVRLNQIQASRLSQLTNIDIREIEGRDTLQLSESLKWRIDPDYFLFRRICGQVVRWDSVSGQYQPVPFATVHVMDTDCDFLGYFPRQVKWAWLYPIFCHEEEITEVLTDECGRFCVWIPWFDIDWVIRWRLERYCFPEIFVKPSIGELLQSAGVLPVPVPGPDPGPVELREAGLSLDHLASIVGRDTASKILLSQQATAVGGNRSTLQRLLNQPAYLNPVAPPTSAKLRELEHLHLARGCNRTEGVSKRQGGSRLSARPEPLRRTISALAVRMGDRGRTGADSRSPGYHILGYPGHGR